MSKTIEVSQEAAIEFRRLHDEIAMLRGLIAEHNAALNKTCNRNRWDEHKCLAYARISPYKTCGDCPRDYLIDLPEPK